jgi:hypothetical protein
VYEKKIVKRKKGGYCKAKKWNSEKIREALKSFLGG